MIAAASIFVACNKDKDNSSEDPSFSGTSLSDLNISQQFSWSSSIKGNFTVIVDAPSNMHVENQIVELQNETGNTIQASTIVDGQAYFNIAVPQQYEKLFVYYPNTQEKVALNTSKSSTTLTLKSVDLDSGLNSELFITEKSAMRKSTSAGSNLVVDGDFENATLLSDNSGYTALRQIGAWYAKGNTGVISTMSGSKVFTSTSTLQNGKILQSFSVNGGQFFDFKYEYGGNAGFYVLFFDAAQRYVGHSRVSVNAGQASAYFLAPEKVSYIQLYGFAGNNEWLDNVTLTEVQEADSDNDGVSDRKDNYPNDPLRAYASYFPTVGKQILAFEDLWPHNGDNDFNDVVLANHIEFSKNSNYDLVDARIKVTINALGAGLANGVGLVLLDESKTPINTEVISSITFRNGSTVGQLDPDVENGIIITNDLFSSVKPYYTNTGSGPSAAPQTLELVVSFKPSAGDLTFTPDFYLFRTKDRGKEIHLPGFTGTSAANTAYYGTGHDVNGTYRNSKGLPWAIEVIYPNSLHFYHPLEKVEVTEAFPQFRAWIQSNGTNYQGWMLYPDFSKVFKQ